MSLLNPGVWIAILLSLLASFGAGYYKGGTDEYVKQQIEIARLNNEARETERKMADDAKELETKLKKAQDDAKTQASKRNAAIDSGALKLRIPVKTPVCPVSTTADAAPASGSDSGTAEIQPETSRAILAIGDEADTTVRKLNACLAIYNQVREMMNQKESK